jgi:hypothetical protein
MLIGLVGRIGTDRFDFGMDEVYHSRMAVVPGPTCTVSALIRYLAQDHDKPSQHPQRFAAENAHAPALRAFLSFATSALIVNSGTRARIRVPWDGSDSTDR